MPAGTPPKREDLAPRPRWTPCTKPWPAVSSCGDSPQPQPLQLLCSPILSSSPAEATGPAVPPSDQPPWSADRSQTTPKTSLTSTIRPPPRHPNSGGPVFLPPMSTPEAGGCWLSLLPRGARLAAQPGLESLPSGPRISSLQHYPVPCTSVSL